MRYTNSVGLFCNIRRKRMRCILNSSSANHVDMNTITFSFINYNCFVNSHPQLNLSDKVLTIDINFLLQAKVLEGAINDMNNLFGKGIVTRLGSAGGDLVYVFEYYQLRCLLCLSLHMINTIQMCYFQFLLIFL